MASTPSRPALYRLGSAAARHPLRIIAVWVIVGVAIGFAAARSGNEVTDDFEIPGVESMQAFELLAERFPEQGGLRIQVVFASDGSPLVQPPLRQAVESSVGNLERIDQVVGVTGPFERPGAVSPDGRVALAEVRFGGADADPSDIDLEAFEEAVAPATDASLQVEFGGDAQAEPEEPGGAAEAIGLGAAVIVLLVAFGSVVAMGLPIVMAIIGLAIGLSSVFLLADVLQVNTVTPIIATMIGLAVGIDYSLFVVSRHRQHLAEGMDVAEAVGWANATAGRSVIVAGLTVMISITGLVLVDISFVTGLAIATVIVVGIAVAAAVTLLPALLGLLGPRIDKLKVPGLHLRAEAGHTTLSARWASVVNARPWLWFLAGLVLLGTLAVPTASMRLGFADAGTAPEDTTGRRAYDLLTDAFGPGFNSPLLLVIDLTDADIARLQAAGDTFQDIEGVAAISPPIPNPDLDTALVQVIPTTSPQSEETEELVHRLRTDLVPRVEEATGAEVFVTGTTALFIDVTDRLVSRLARFMLAVLGLSFLLLLVVFRSIAVPLKAAFLNLLAIGAAYGIIVAIFQWGWLKSVVGVAETVPIAPFVPMMMFAILFGLSMDYEVFILSRVREEWLRHGDAADSVVQGLAKSARVVTAAATIMVAVFASFIQQDDITIKLFGLGLAVAVALDATVVRMVLVPSFMQLLGERNWWFPRWLEWLPRLDVEGHAPDGFVTVAEAARTVRVKEAVVHTLADRGTIASRASDGDRQVRLSDLEDVATRARAQLATKQAKRAPTRKTRSPKRTTTPAKRKRDASEA